MKKNANPQGMEAQRVKMDAKTGGVAGGLGHRTMGISKGTPKQKQEPKKRNYRAQRQKWKQQKCATRGLYCKNQCKMQIFS